MNNFESVRNVENIENVGFENVSVELKNKKKQAGCSNVIDYNEKQLSNTV